MKTSIVDEYVNAGMPRGDCSTGCSHSGKISEIDQIYID
ncbi:hypothetical protein V474_13150 [Novosphingobium barchaimii LL02]|uniref:Uncharacterized protein n=1 Tax=Novosphingobium barchaimii LL02 TaxID=1114963 RepID=A0A0J8AQ96_9SPHN|nr:hypothetical protein V474_13150 [Novosphingobium barchaimii LL02]